MELSNAFKFGSEGIQNLEMILYPCLKYANGKTCLKMTPKNMKQSDSLQMDSQKSDTASPLQQNLTSSH